MRILALAALLFVSLADAQVSRPCPPTIWVDGETPGEPTASCGLGEFGHFEGRPRLEWLEDGRKMQLLESFTYVDPKDKRWTSKKGAVVDGASIPRFLWSFVGGPYEGQWRNASIPHDTECDAKANPWRDVHRMFYNGVRAGGVGWVKGNLMYGAVYACGPRWGDASTPLCGKSLEDIHRDSLVRLLVLLRRLMVTRDFSLNDVEARMQGGTAGYALLKQEVTDSDPDLKVVRNLLAQRQVAELAGDRAALDAIDQALFETPPATVIPGRT